MRYKTEIMEKNFEKLQFLQRGRNQMFPPCTYHQNRNKTLVYKMCTKINILAHVTRISVTIYKLWDTKYFSFT